MKKHTHAKGFNVTSIEGLSVIYLFRNTEGEVLYVGQSEGNIRKRIISHDYGINKKLTSDVVYIDVLPIKNLYSILYLESLLIWYFNPKRNQTISFFSKEDSTEKVLVKINKNENPVDSVEEFLLKLECGHIEREWEEDGNLKKYGEIERFSNKVLKCRYSSTCLCYSCLIKRKNA